MSGDALEMARRVDRVGDAVLLAALRPSATRREQYQAVRGAPFLRAPEAALTRLVELAAGRDPRLAPAAMRSVLQIARKLSARALAEREAQAGPLRAVLSDLGGLAADESARHDLRTMANLARLEIAALFSWERR